MRLVLAFLLLLAGSASAGCRAIHDDQETRPLPAPLPPAQVTTERSVTEREEPPRRPPARAPRADDDEPKPRAVPVEPSTEVPTADAGVEPAPDAARSRCLDLCRQALSACVTASVDGGTSLEACRSTFESCKTSCG